MERNEFYQLLGQITYSFSRIDFLISNIAVDLGLADHYTDFYGGTNFKKKIIDLKEKASVAIPNIEMLEKFDSCMDKLDVMRETRNNFIHSTILENKDELLLYRST